MPVQCVLLPPTSSCLPAPLPLPAPCPQRGAVGAAHLGPAVGRHQPLAGAQTAGLLLKSGTVVQLQRLHLPAGWLAAVSAGSPFPPAEGMCTTREFIY